MNTKKIVYSGMLISIGLILPYIFHLGFGPSGKVFLPIHYGGFFAGLFLGPFAGLLVGFLTPIISTTLLTPNMPPFPMFWFIAVEVAVYGFVAGLLYAKLRLNIYVSMIIAMVFGKVIYYLTAYFIGMRILNSPMMTVVLGWDLITSALIGQALQLLIIPIVVKRLKKVTNLQLNREFNNE